MVELSHQSGTGVPTCIYGASTVEDETLEKFREIYRSIHEIEAKVKNPCEACESRSSDSCLCDKSVEYIRMRAYVDGAHWAAGYMLNRGITNGGGGGGGGSNLVCETPSSALTLRQARQCLPASKNDRFSLSDEWMCIKYAKVKYNVYTS